MSTGKKSGLALLAGAGAGAAALVARKRAAGKQDEQAQSAPDAPVAGETEDGDLPERLEQDRDAVEVGEG